MRARGQLDRSLAALTIGMHMSARDRHRALMDTKTGEYEQQVHVPLSGVAAAGWGFTDRSINWELPFLYAPLQRRAPWDKPHFTHGIEFVRPPSDLVVITAHVVRWTVSEEGWVCGATARFGVSAPNATAAGVGYSAIAHLSFQGFASSVEGEEFQA